MTNKKSMLKGESVENRKLKHIKKVVDELLKHNKKEKKQIKKCKSHR